MPTSRIYLSLLTFVVVIGVAGSVFAQPLPSWYHNNAGIHSFLMDLQTRFPNTIHVDSIGHGQQWGYPIWMARISNNATIRQDKPRVLLIGQVHAEEVMGVELCLRLAAEICSTYTTNTAPARYRDWRGAANSGEEIYIIPSANPEGLQVVTNNWDVTYRKNVHNIWHPFLNDSLIFAPDVGNDSDGIDLNRNFPVNWERGDTLLQPLWTGTQIELWDYYRGASPGSEAETQTLMRVNRDLKPMYCFVYHSSRQGGLSQKIFFPWDWEASGSQVVTPGRRSSDFDLCNMVGSEVSQNMRCTNGNDPYQFSGYRTRNGAAQDWFYQSTGCVAMEVEVGPATRNAHQPDSLTWRTWMDLMIAGNYVLFNRSLDQFHSPTGSSITGIVSDASSGQPLPGTEVRVRELYNRLLDPRVTNEVGRFNRPMVSGNYTLEFRKYGYATQVFPNIILSSTQRRPQNATLVPLPQYHFSFHVTDNNSSPVQALIVLKHPDRDNDTLTSDASGNANTILVVDTFIVSINHPSYVARVDTVIPASEGQAVNVRLIPVGTRVQEGFENGLANWTSSDGHWGTDNQAYSGAHGFSNAPGGNWWYPDSAHSYTRNTNTFATWSNTFDLSTSATDASLTYCIRGQLEPEHDSSWVEISTNGGTNWQALPGTNQWKLRFDWTQVNVSLRHYLGNANVKFRWHLVSDSLINQSGIHIDDIEVRSSTQDSSIPPVVIPYVYDLGKPYPNPFNASLRIPYSVKVPGIVDFRVYDVTGRTLAVFSTKALAAGKHDYIWDASQALHGEPASGLYFVEMKSGTFRAITKVMLLK